MSGSSSTSSTTPPENNDITIPGDEAYLSFGGWAKPMPNPPKMHERRRYIVDVECTDAGLKSSSKGERSTRSLSILRVSEVVGAKVPAPDENENQGALWPDEDGDGDNPAPDASEAGGKVVQFSDKPGKPGKAGAQ